MFWFSLVVGAHAQMSPTAITWCLPSGLRVLYERQPGRRDVTMVAVVGAGSAEDPPGKEGLAHLVEHLWFRTPLVVASEGLTGTQRNAVTREDTTTYLAEGSRRAVRDLLAVEAHRLSDPLRPSPEILASEQAIVTAELHQNWTGLASALGVLRANVFGAAHPYGHLGIGTAASVASATADDVERWVDATYTPANTTWSIVADLDPPKLEQLLREALGPQWGEGDLGDCDPSPVPEVALPADPETATRFAPVEAAVPASFVTFGWALPPGPRTASIAQFVMWIVDGELGDDGACDVMPGERGTFAFCAIFDGDPKRAEAAMRKALDGERRWFEPNQRMALDSAHRTFALADADALAMDLDDPSVLHLGAQVDRAVVFHTHGYTDLAWFRRKANELPDLTVAADFARTYLRLERAGAVRVAPAKDDRWPVAPHSVRAFPPLPPVHAGEVDLERLKTYVAEPDLSAARTFALPNGLVVDLVPWSSTHVRAALVTGAVDADPVHRAYAVRAIRSLDGAVDLDVAAQRAHADWAPTALRRGHVVWEVQAPAALDAVELLALRREQAALGGLGVDKFLDVLGEVDPDQRPDLEALHLFGRDPEVVDPALVATARATLTKRGARDLLANMLRPDVSRLVLVGRFDPDVLQTRIDARFATWTAVGAPPKPPPPPVPAPLPTERRVWVRPAEDRVLTQVRVACRIDAERMGDVGLLILKAAVQDELTQRLRVEGGATYGVSIDAGAGEALAVETQVPALAVGSALQAVFDALAGAAAGMPADTLARWKLDAARRSPLDDRTVDALAVRYLEAAIDGVPAVRSPGLAERIHAVTAEAIADGLAPCVGREAVTVVGAETPSTVSLDENGIAWARAP